MSSESENEANARRQRALDSQRQELAAFREQMDKAYDDRLAGVIRRRLLRVTQTQLGAQIVYLQRCIADLESMETPTDGGAALELGDVTRMCRQFADPAKRRRLIESVHSNCFWMAGKLELDWRQPTENATKIRRAWTRYRRRCRPPVPVELPRAGLASSSAVRRSRG